MSRESSPSQSGSPAYPSPPGSGFPVTRIEGNDHATDGAESDVIHVNCNILTDEQLNLLLSHVAHRAVAGLDADPTPTLAPASPFIMPSFPAMQAGQPLQLDKPIPTLFPSVSPETISEIIHFEFFPADLYKLDPTSLEKGLDTTTKDHYPHLASLIGPLSMYFRILGCYAASSNSPDAVVAILNASLAYCAHLSSLNLTYKWPALLQYHNQFFFRRSREMARGKFSGWFAPDNELIAQVLFGHNLSQDLSQCQDRSRYTSQFLLVAICFLQAFAVVAKLCF